MGVLDNKVSRREAMGTILKTVALAAGISIADLKLLLSSADAATLTDLKMLKVVISGMNRQVFESEFGRVTPQVPVNRLPGTRIKPGQILPGGVNPMGCMVNFGGMAGAAGCAVLESCMSNGGGTCPLLGDCQGNSCVGQDIGGGGTGGSGPNDCGRNLCDGQDCSTMSSCGTNACDDQDCPNLRNCGENKRDVIMGLADQFRNDPYIQGLMRQFNVTTANQLSTQVSSMLRQRRYMTPTQVLQAPAVKTPMGTSPLKGMGRP